MELTKVQGSSNIEAIGYTEESQTLAVQFKGRKGAAGSLYEYAHVPVGVRHDFLQAVSKGSFFASDIKGKGYPATRIQ